MHPAPATLPFLGTCDGYPEDGWTVAIFYPDGGVERVAVGDGYDRPFPSSQAAYHAAKVSEAFTRLALDLVFSGIRLNDNGA